MNSHFLDPHRIRIADSLVYPKAGFIIADAALAELYPDFFQRQMGLPTLYIQSQEEYKDLNNVRRIYYFLSQHLAQRSDLIHVFGGGLLCDLAGYATATFKRGCRLKLYPSTLLAMVDAALGGKCAINFSKIKNQVGCFYPAEEIIIHPAFLHTLPTDELRQGKAEMLKAYYTNAELSAIDLSSSSLPCAAQILEYGRFKLEICARDPYDQGLRRTLNFGHSFGHALERLMDFGIRHGDSVVAGMRIAVDLSLHLGWLNAQAEPDFQALWDYPMPEPWKGFQRGKYPLELLSNALQDKKNEGEGLMLVLPVAARQVELHKVSLDQISALFTL